LPLIPMCTRYTQEKKTLIEFLRSPYLHAPVNRERGAPIEVILSDGMAVGCM
jgi:hypothetical protein